MDSVPEPRRAVLIGAKADITQHFADAVQQAGFEVEHFETIETFLHNGKFHYQCFYFIHVRAGPVSCADFIKLIRVNDLHSLIYAVTTDTHESAVVSTLKAGADFCVQNSLNVERALIEVNNFFLKLDHLYRIKITSD